MVCRRIPTRKFLVTLGTVIFFNMLTLPLKSKSSNLFYSSSVPLFLYANPLYGIYPYSSRTMPLEELLYDSLWAVLVSCIITSEKLFFCFLNICQQRESSTKEVQTVRIMSRVRTGTADKSSYHLKYTRNCVCQRIAFAGFQTTDIDIVYVWAIVSMCFLFNLDSVLSVCYLTHYSLWATNHIT